MSTPKSTPNRIERARIGAHLLLQRLLDRNKTPINPKSFGYGFFTGLIGGAIPFIIDQPKWFWLVLVFATVAKVFHGTHSPNQEHHLEKPGILRYLDNTSRRIHYLSFGTGIFTALTIAFGAMSFIGPRNLIPTLACAVFAKLCYTNPVNKPTTTTQQRKSTQTT